MKTNSILVQSKTKNIIKKTFLAFDVENNGHLKEKTNFLCACCYGYIKDDNRKLIKIEKTFLDKQEMQDFVLGLPKKYKTYLAFFNLNYDKTFFEGILKDDRTLTVNGKCISFETINGYKAIDLAKHCTKGKLKDWMEWADLGIEKIPFENEDDKPHTATSQLIKRCQSDTKATYLLAEFIQNFYNKQGVSMRLTIGSTALALFQKEYFKSFWKRNYQTEENEISPEGELEARALYGGRTEVLKKGKNNSEIKTWAYDINSAYLSIMRDEFLPDINPYNYYNDGCKDEYIENLGKFYKTNISEKDLKELDKLYIADVLIEAPDTNIPYLPFKTKDKLLFPVGIWRASYTSVDIKEALKYGYKIKKVYQIIIYRKKTKLFKEYAETIWDMRAEYKSQNNKGMDTMTKLLGNSLYGKFSQRNPLTNYLGDYKGYQEALLKMEKTLGRKLIRDIDFVLREHKVKGFHNKDNLLYEISCNIKLPSRNYFPAISAFITSYCRQKLFKAMNDNKDILAYVDTDCIKITRIAKGGDIDIGKGLGQWEKEKEPKTEHLLAPKLYGDKKKGVKDNAIMLYQDDDNQYWEQEKPITQKEAIRLGDLNLINKWQKQVKILSKHDTKRIWDLREGTSQPININDYTKQDTPISLIVK